MVLDWEQMGNLLITCGFGVIGWFVTMIMRDHDVTRQTISEIRIELPSKYVSKDDLMGHLNRIEAMLTKIFDRLEQKVDK
jgi:hypothetical protein